jgi:hypothetical protein
VRVVREGFYRAIAQKTIELPNYMNIFAFTKQLIIGLILHKDKQPIS